MNDISVFRQEQKYVVSCETAAKLKERLSCVLKCDSNAESGAYIVRSLYFDTVENSDFFTKLAGTENRRKIRLRTYGKSGSPTKLELKEKCGAAQKKTSVVLSQNEARALLLGNYSVLVEHHKESSAAVRLNALLRCGLYRPRVLMEYSRTAFVHPVGNTRITFDSNLSKSESNLDFFADVPLTPVFCGRTVLEVKFSRNLPVFVSELLSQFCLTQEAMSKYCNSRKIFYDFSY